MKSSKRRLTAILCLTALMLISTSCRDTGAPSDTTTGDSESVSDTTVETTEERISTGLEPRDFDGYVFQVLESVECDTIMESYAGADSRGS